MKGNYSADCFAKPVTALQIKTKIELISKLLNFEHDTSICIHPPKKLHNLSTQLEMPVGEYYKLQIEALILINLLAFGSDVFLYSPYPVIFDIKKEVEVFQDQSKISQAYGVYKEWFKNNKEKCFSHYTYPDLDKVGLRWFGVAVSSKYYSNCDIFWQAYFDCPNYD